MFESSFPQPAGSIQEEKWGLVELVGYQQFFGKITEETLHGRHTIRIDVPATDVHPAYSCTFEMAAIHRITPIHKDTALELNRQRERGRFKYYATK